MNKINWNQKLSSRKFWIALVAFITSLLYALNYAEADIEKVTSIVMSFSTLIIYILTEGYIDAKRESGDIIIETKDVFDRNSNK